MAWARLQPPIATVFYALGPSDYFRDRCDRAECDGKIEEVVCAIVGIVNADRRRRGDTRTMFDAIRQDLRHALRHLRRSPTFSLGATCTLALGIGLSAAVFGALNALVLRPVPITDRAG
jgi:hypothetical protein